MDNFIGSLNEEQKEEINNLTKEEKFGLDTLFKVTTALIDKSINDINFSDLDYISNLDNINLTEEKVKLSDGATVSYNEAINIFKNSIVDKKKQFSIISGIFLDLLDIYSSKVVKECNNDYDRYITISRIISFSKNMNQGTLKEFNIGDEINKIDVNKNYKNRSEAILEDNINNFPEFGITPEKFSSLFAQAKEEDNFEKIITNMKANTEINRMEINKIAENIKGNKQKYIQQLDSITENLENITYSIINDSIEKKNLDLERIYNNNIYFKDLILVMQKYQEVSEKIKDSEEVGKNFKTKLEQSCKVWGENFVKTGAKIIDEFYKKEPNNKEKMIETMSKISMVIDSLVNKSKIRETLGSSYLENFLGPNSRIFYEENIGKITNKKAELLNNITNKKENLSSRIKSTKNSIKEKILSIGRKSNTERQNERQKQQNNLGILG